MDVSEEMNTSSENRTNPKSGEILVQYNNEFEYITALNKFKDELESVIAVSASSNEWREIRSSLSDVRDKLKGMFFKEEDTTEINEQIRIALENINTRQAAEHEKADAESQEAYDSVIGIVNDAVEFANSNNDYKQAREKLLSAQDSFKSLKLKRSHRDELYRLINAAFDNVSQRQNEERENYEMECIENYHSMKHKIEAAVEFANHSEIYAEARKALIAVQSKIKGLKLKRDQRDELYQIIRTAFDDVNKRQEEDRNNFNAITEENFDKLSKVIADAISFAQTSEEYSLSREQLINAQNQIKATKLKREHRDKLYADIRAVFEDINEKQSHERDEYHEECSSNYDKLTEKVNDCFALVLGSTEFNMIRESLITVQGEVRIARLRREQRNELFARIREAFNNFDKKKSEYFEQRKEEKIKKLNEIKFGLEEKITRLNAIMSKDKESLEIQMNKLGEAGIDEFLINEVNGKISNIKNRIQEKQESIEQANARIAEIDIEITKL